MYLRYLGHAISISGFRDHDIVEIIQAPAVAELPPAPIRIISSTVNLTSLPHGAVYAFPVAEFLGPQRANFSVVGFEGGQK